MGHMRGGLLVSIGLGWASQPMRAFGGAHEPTGAHLLCAALFIYITAYIHTEHLILNLGNLSPDILLEYSCL